jgi:hypothetical protein
MLSFFPTYFKWHYGRALVEAFAIWKTFLWFTLHEFRVGLHLRTLFSRFHRLGEEYEGSAIDFAEIASAFLVNTIMRIVGVLLRLVVIVMGLIAFFVVLIGGGIFFVFWIAYPLIVIGTFFLGVSAFFV